MLHLGDIKKIVIDGNKEITMPGGDEYGLVQGTLTEYENDRVTKIRNHAFRDCSFLKTANLPAATSVGSYVFQNCSSLTTANLPAATSVGSYVFQSCSSLTTANLPAATSVGSHAFYNCFLLTTVDLPLATNVGNYAFRYCYSLITLILRDTTNVCTLDGASVFTNCYHLHGTVNSDYNPDGLQDGYIYVPASLIEDYKTADNWSTLATQFRALEDFTVDGTTTGELDESKI